MNKIIVFLIGIVNTYFLFSSCSSYRKDDSLSLKMINEDTLFVCDMSAINNKIDISLSDWIEDFKIVRFENTDTALFKSWKVYITDHYIGILQSAVSPFKLFDHTGKFICDVGGIGQGVGEYTTLYSAAIDERNEAVWLAPFSGEYLWKYNLKGEHILTVKTEQMNKPQIRGECDSSLTMTHLCFTGMSGYQYVHIYSPDSLHYVKPNKYQAIMPRDKDGNFTGFNHELWFYNNSNVFTYMTTYSDTLYAYDRQSEQTFPRFTAIHHPNDYCIYNEVPSGFLISNSGYLSSSEKNKTNMVWVDKNGLQAYYVEITNDQMGGLPASNFAYSSNGWYYEMFEPYQLIELIRKRLSGKDCGEKEQTVLQKMLGSIDEDGNNILFMGKLKSYFEIK